MVYECDFLFFGHPAGLGEDFDIGSVRLELFEGSGEVEVGGEESDVIARMCLGEGSDGVDDLEDAVGAGSVVGGDTVLDEDS